MPKQHFDSSCWYVLPLCEGSSTRVVFQSSTLIPDAMCTATLQRGRLRLTGGRGSMPGQHFVSKGSVCAATFAKSFEDCGALCGLTEATAGGWFSLAAKATLKSYILTPVVRYVLPLLRGVVSASAVLAVLLGSWVCSRGSIAEQHLDSRSTGCTANFATGCLRLTGGRDSMPKQHFDSSCW